MPGDNETTKGQVQQQETPKMGDKISQDTNRTAQGDDLTAPIAGNQRQQQITTEDDEPVEDNIGPEEDTYDETK